MVGSAVATMVWSSAARNIVSIRLMTMVRTSSEVSGAGGEIDGASLTVNSVQGNVFGINLIPHTQNVTTLGKLKAGSRVNLEIDTLARYVARLQQWSKTS